MTTTYFDILIQNDNTNLSDSINMDCRFDTKELAYEFITNFKENPESICPNIKNIDKYKKLTYVITKTITTTIELEII